ncbi:MAG: SGNH/GDSL hydrolase family protein [Sedimentisphaerales bacterium]|nr:SGNH/GDSL hydrolase family protein [Sedimentisphaerales bacterium]
MKTQLRWYSFRWRILILTLLPILTFGGYIGWRLHLATRRLPIGSGPAGPSVPSGPFNTPWTQRQVVLLGLGDSVTRGFGVPEEKSYIQLLSSNLDTFYPDMKGKDLSVILPHLKMLNLAQDYTTTQQHINQQLPCIPQYDSEVYGIVVITSGGNDLIHDYGRSKPVDGAMYGCTSKQAIEWTGNIKKRLRTILQRVTEKFPGGCQIFLANIYDPTDGVGDPQIVGLPRWPDCIIVLALTNQKIRELCDEYANVHLVDLHAEFMGHGFHCTDWWRNTYRKEDPGHWYHTNIEDPNVRGYDAIRRLFLLQIVGIIQKDLLDEKI